MTTQDLEMQAQRNLSSYEGDETSYVGMGDDALSFNGSPAKSFIAEQDSDVAFSFKLVNTFATDKVVALSAAYFQTPADLAASFGSTVDAIIADGLLLGSATAGLTATASLSNFSINGLMGFVKYNPTRIVELVINSTSASTFGKVIQTGTISPFRRQSQNQLSLTNVTRPEQFNDKKGFINLANRNDFQLDNQNVILFTVGAGESIDLTYKIGAVLNNARSLSKKATKPGQTINALGLMRR